MRLAGSTATRPIGAPLARVIITGEYPPQPGGVSAYSLLVAEGLARAGEEVHVFAPRCAGPTPARGGVEVHRLPGWFGPRALRAMSRALDALPRPRRLLVQYVPHAFGWRAMNLPLCLWLASRPEPLDVMFHEVAYPWRARPQALALAAAHRAMGAVLARAADRAYLSTTAWLPLLRRMGLRRPGTWLPVPSNLPEQAEPQVVAHLRERLCPAPHRFLVGHFGTHGDLIAPLAVRALGSLLRARDDCAALLVGRGSEELRRRWAEAQPALARRLHATGGVAAAAAAAHLAACDVLVQPYPDGVTTRRGSLMAALALGLPVVTNAGRHTERVWRDAGAVVVADTPEGVGDAAGALLGDPARRAELGRRAAALYRERFSVAATVEALRGVPAAWRAGLA